MAEGRDDRFRPHLLGGRRQDLPTFSEAIGVHLLVAGSYMSHFLLPNLPFQPPMQQILPSRAHTPADRARLGQAGVVWGAEHGLQQGSRADSGP